MRDAAAMRRVIDAFHPDAIVHLAARAGVRPSIQDPALYAAVNVLGTTVLLDAARAAKISRLIIASSSSVYGERCDAAVPRGRARDSPDQPLRRDEARGGADVRDVRGLCDWMRIISLRFFTVYGPRQRPDLAIHSFTRKISRASPCRSSATERRSATTRTSRTPCRACSAPSIGRARRTPGHEIFNLGESAVTSLSDARRADRAAPSAGRRRSSGFRRSRATCGARSPIFPGRESTWGTRRRCR